MSPDDIAAIAEAAADRAIQKTMLTIGLDVIDAEQILKLQADFRHLRQWRESVEAVKKKTLLTALAFLVTAGLGWLLVALHR